MSMGIVGVAYNLREDRKAQYIGYEAEISVSITELESDYRLFIPGFAEDSIEE